MCISAIELSEIVNNYAVGVGALFAGGAGFKILWDWNEERKLKNKFRIFSNIYSVRDLGKTFTLVKNSPSPKIYVLDSNTNELHWIDGDAFSQLNYPNNPSSWKEISRDELSSYKEGDPIIAP